MKIVNGWVLSQNGAWIRLDSVVAFEIHENTFKDATSITAVAVLASGAVYVLGRHASLEEAAEAVDELILHHV